VPRRTDKETAAAPQANPAAYIPEQLDKRARAEIRDAQAVMRQLIERLPRDFDYADEMALIFRPSRGD
jgi:hypothetical protein